MVNSYGTDTETVKVTPTNVSTNTEAISTDGRALAEDLLARCQTLLHELEEFKIFVTEQGLEQEPAVDIHKFHTSVTTEHKSLQKLADADLTAEKTIHTLRSSNLPFCTSFRSLSFPFFD